MNKSVGEAFTPVVIICSVMKLTLVSGSESSLLSTRPVTNDADILQFNDVFRISINEDRLYSCSVQLHVISVIEDREQCWVRPNVWLVFLVSLAKPEGRFWGFDPACFLTSDHMWDSAYLIIFDSSSICIQSRVPTGAKVLNQKLQKDDQKLLNFATFLLPSALGSHKQHHHTLQHGGLILNTADDLQYSDTTGNCMAIVSPPKCTKCNIKFKK